MFGKMCHLNTFPSVTLYVWQDVLSEYLTSMFFRVSRFLFEYLEQNLNLNFRAKREEKFCLNTWSQTRIRPGFEAESHEQEQSQEPDAHQASIQSPKPRARAKPRARRASGQHSEPEATSKSNAREHAQSPKPDACGGAPRTSAS